MTTMSADLLPRITTAEMNLMAWLVFKIHSFLAQDLSVAVYRFQVPSSHQYQNVVIGVGIEFQHRNIHA